MDYNLFHMAWQEALAGAGLQPWSFVDEIINLRNMARAYRTRVSLGGMPPADAFNVTAEPRRAFRAQRLLDPADRENLLDSVTVYRKLH